MMFPKLPQYLRACALEHSLGFPIPRYRLLYGDPVGLPFATEPAIQPSPMYITVAVAFQSRYAPSATQQFAYHAATTVADINGAIAERNPSPESSIVYCLAVGDAARRVNLAPDRLVISVLADLHPSSSNPVSLVMGVRQLGGGRTKEATDPADLDPATRAANADAAVARISCVFWAVHDDRRFVLAGLTSDEHLALPSITLCGPVGDNRLGDAVMRHLFEPRWS